MSLTKPENTKHLIDSPVLEKNTDHSEIIYVNKSSELEFKNALEELAINFKKEFRYTHLQYCVEEHDPDCVGFVITEKAMDLVETLNQWGQRR